MKQRLPEFVRFVPGAAGSPGTLPREQALREFWKDHDLWVDARAPLSGIGGIGPPRLEFDRRFLPEEHRRLRGAESVGIMEARDGMLFLLRDGRLAGPRNLRVVVEGDRVVRCDRCSFPMVRTPEGDEPIHWGDEPHRGGGCEHDEGIFEEYTCTLCGHVYAEPFD